MTTCPFCSDTLLRHIRSRQTYWLCRRCHLKILDTELRSALSPSLTDTTFSPAAHASKPQVEEEKYPVHIKKISTNTPMVQS